MFRELAKATRFGPEQWDSVCLNCGAIFRTKEPQKYCTTYCEVEHSQSRPLKKSKKVKVERVKKFTPPQAAKAEDGQWDCTCLNCGIAFKAVRPIKYCKLSCQNEYYQKESAARGRYLILERDEFRCIYCGLSSVEDATQLHVDHIIPRLIGGKDEAENLVTACQTCNLSKSASLLSGEVLTRIQAEVKKRNKIKGIHNRLTIKLA